MTLTLTHFDEAVEAYFKSIYQNTVYAPTDLAIKKASQEGTLEKAKLPLISIFRTPTLQMGNHTNDPGFRRGYLNYKDTEDGIIHKMRVLPVQVEYQVDIWGNTIENTNLLFGEVLFTIQDTPAFEVTIPRLSHNVSSVMHLTEITDNTDLLEEEERGRFGRMTLTVTVDAILLNRVGHKMASIFPVDFEIQ